MKRLDKKTLADEIAKLKRVYSVQNKTYHSINVKDGKVKFVREGKSSHESIDLDELFQFYVNVNHPTTTEARNYISGRVQSPAVAILNALSGSRGSLPQPEKNVTKETSAQYKHVNADNLRQVDAQKDETRFFKALAELVGVAYLKSKSISKPVSSADLFLSDHFMDYGFDPETEECFSTILKALHSNFLFGSKSLAHHLDAICINHPKLGTRIIEFDEEQHFTPALHTALKIQTQQINNVFNEHYIKITNDLNYLNNAVFRKHRIKNRLSAYPVNFTEFLKWLQDVKEKESGYIEAKENGFPYLGGRIAQRAYYDCLRNAAHLSPINKGLQPPLRFTKKYFEDATGKVFNALSADEIIAIIVKYLQTVYKLKIQ